MTDNGGPRGRGRRGGAPGGGRVTLRFLADQLGLSPATVSVVLNRSPVAATIPQRTHERILAAAARFDYTANPVARALQGQRSFTVGVMLPEFSEGYASLVMTGIEDHLLQAGYLYFVASHRHRPDLIEEYPRVFLQRAVDGLIAVDTPCPKPLPVPVVAVSGHGRTRGVTNIVLDHDRAAELALGHLAELGHRRVAFVRGQAFSSDTEVRWDAIRRAAPRFGLRLEARLTVQLEGDSPDVGHAAACRLLANAPPFSALFAFNDVSAMGAIRALREAGRRVPDDVSVVGFDDVHAAALHTPALTTVRQPLRRMGELAAATLIERIVARQAPRGGRVTVEPELIVRASTARVALPVS